MKIIIKEAIIVAPDQQWHMQKKDLVIENGILQKITDHETSNGHQIIHIPGLHVSEGWFDSSVSFGEPGFEDRGSILNGLQAAAAGGFTAVALQPDTLPVSDNVTTIRFMQNAAKHAVEVYPIGTLTKKMEGAQLAELYDMHLAGAVAFGDYKKNIDNTNLLKTALQYTADFNGLILAHAQDNTLTGGGVAHEGKAAVQIGLRGIPALAEEVMVARNLLLLEYTGGRMHIPCISTAGAVKLIREAKNQGLNITCSVAVHHLLLTDEVLTDFDTRFKLNPPLRDNETRKILIEAVLDDTIDMVTSDHRALAIEQKKVEFDLALDGTIGLESALGTLLQVLPIDIAIKKLTAGRQRFGAKNAKIEVGKQANITLFNPHATYTFTQEHIVSKSKNAAMEGYLMQGIVIGTIANNELLLN